MGFILRLVVAVTRLGPGSGRIGRHGLPSPSLAGQCGSASCSATRTSTRSASCP